MQQDPELKKVDLGTADYRVRLQRDGVGVYALGMQSASRADAPPVKDLGYYYTDWIWPSGSIDFMKSMLLFFDGLALALPSDLAAQVVDRDPILAAPLAERGLLVNFDPVKTMATNSADRLAVTLTAIIKQYPPLRRRSRDPLVDELVMVHWGSGIANPGTVRVLERALVERGLISPMPELGTFRIDDGVRTLILMLFAQTLRNQLVSQGISLHLATDSDSMIFDMAYELERYVQRDFSRIEYSPKNPRQTLNPLQLTDDLRSVGADLSRVPLDEVLSFREENGRHYRAYARGLRELLAVLAHAEPTERQRILQERKLELREQAIDLRRASRVAFGTRMTTLLLSLAGAAWTLHTGDPVGALLAGASADVQAAPSGQQSVTAYSYLLKALNL